MKKAIDPKIGIQKWRSTHYWHVHRLVRRKPWRNLVHYFRKVKLLLKSFLHGSESNKKRFKKSNKTTLNLNPLLLSRIYFCWVSKQQTIVQRTNQNCTKFHLNVQKVIVKKGVKSMTYWPKEISMLLLTDLKVLKHQQPTYCTCMRHTYRENSPHFPVPAKHTNCSGSWE